MKIGTNIKKLRTARNMTQDQLAEQLYVTRQTVSSWERSASNPSLEQLEAIAKALDADLMVLLYGPQNCYHPSRRQVVGTIILVLAALALWAACWKLGPWSNWMMKDRGILGYYVFYYYYLLLTAVLGGAGILALARLRWELPLKGRGRRICLAAGLVLLAAALVSLPVGLSLGARNSYLWVAWLSTLLFRVCLRGLIPALGLLSGALLCLSWQGKGRREAIP